MVVHFICIHIQIIINLFYRFLRQNACTASTKLGIDLMKDPKRPGVIVNLSAIYGIKPLPQAPIFSASKAAVLSATLGFSVSTLVHIQYPFT